MLTSSSDVCFQGQPGRHLLRLSSSGFDPLRTSRRGPMRLGPTTSFQLRRFFWNKSNHGGLSEIPSNQGRTTMKLATIALASAFALSSTFAIAATSQHKYKSGVRTHQGTVGMGRSMNRTNQGTVGMGRYGGSSNSRGGLVGGADPGTYKP
jgi:hypothetical protein